MAFTYFQKFIVYEINKSKIKYKLFWILSTTKASTKRQTLIVIYRIPRINRIQVRNITIYKMNRNTYLPTYVYMTFCHLKTGQTSQSLFNST